MKQDENIDLAKTALRSGSAEVAAWSSIAMRPEPRGSLHRPKHPLVAKFGRIALAFAMLCSLTMLSGCRYSDTLLEIIIDPWTGVLEAHADPEYHETEGAPLDPTKASVHLAENENLAQQDNFLPIYKEDAPPNGQAVNRKYKEATVDDYDAVEGNERDDLDSANSSTSEETEQSEDPEATGEGESADETQSADEGDGTIADKTAGRGGTGQVYGEGSYEELPDARALAARGQYALITQMLAGKGGLAATDSKWVADMQRRGAFPGEGLEDIPVVWNDEGALDIEALVASDADAILVDGVEVSLTPDQESLLLQEGFNIVSVPAIGQTFTQDEDIVMAVKVVGQVLSGLNSDATLSTADMVNSYVEQHDTAINGCLNANNGYSYKMAAGIVYKGIYQGTSTVGEPTNRLSETRITTACIDSWGPSSGAATLAKRSFGWHEIYRNDRPMDISGGVGLSATSVGGNFILSDYYMQVSGVVNNAYEDAKPVSSTAEEVKSYPYVVMAGLTDNVTPVLVGARKVPSALWYSEQPGSNPADHWNLVGDANFPAIVVRDADIAGKVVSSAAKVDGLYNVGQPYQVYQMPAGVAGNWFDGNVESFLISVWTYGLFQESSIETPREWVEGFYQQFYRIDADAISHLEGFNAAFTAECPTG